MVYSKVSETTAHRVRWTVTLLWLILIASLFYDPFSAWLIQPGGLLSSYFFYPSNCIEVQGQCLELSSYALGGPIFWLAIVPASIFVMLVFGHEFWRRICPLSFLSQLPRALNSQRRVKRITKQGKVRYEVAKIETDSWLSQNYLYVQLGLLFLGLCCRILFLNSNRTALGVWLLSTIVAAVGVGWYYGGKSWCNYFCPMSPPQKIFSEPKGMLTSPSHIVLKGLPQSMCRTVTSHGKEVSDCVGCQMTCIDIDSERSYWENISKLDRKVLYYGYLGMIVGYFSYHYLYAGNWNYLIYGIWVTNSNQFTQLFNPGFYLFGQSIPISKLVAVPLTIGCSSILFVGLGYCFEAWYRRLCDRIRTVDSEIRQHEIYTLITFVCFNLFFIFVSSSINYMLPAIAMYILKGSILILSSIWLLRTWKRSFKKA